MKRLFSFRVAVALLCVGLLCLCVDRVSAFSPAVKSVIFAKAPAATAKSMVTPIFSAGGPTLGPSTTVSNFLPLYAQSTSASWSGTDSRATPVAVPGTFSGLNVKFPAGVGTGTWQITVNKNTVSQSLTCTISSGTTCTDPTNSFTIAAGDKISYKATPASAPTAATVVQISMLFTSANPGEGFVASAHQSSTPSTTAVNYASFIASSTISATEATNSALVATNGVVDNIFVEVGTAPGTAASGKKYDYVVFQNGVAAPAGCTPGTDCLGCTILEIATKCNTVGSGMSVTLATDDLISLQITPTSTPAAGTLNASMRWVPTIAGESLVATVPQSLPATNSTGVFGLNGSGTVGTESNVYYLAPLTSATLKKFTEIQAPAPGGATTRSFALHQTGSPVGSPGSAGCTVLSAGVGCTDNTNAYSTSSTDLLTIGTSVSGANAALTKLKMGMVATVP